ncbi:hypothetical protein ACOBV8_21305 (plasmid) [Pseudoalteromonas espejiana]
MTRKSFSTLTLLLKGLNQRKQRTRKPCRYPDYDRSKLKAGIVHIGVGGFHEIAHQGVYVNELLKNARC